MTVNVCQSTLSICYLVHDEITSASVVNKLSLSSVSKLLLLMPSLSKLPLLLPSCLVKVVATIDVIHVKVVAITVTIFLVKVIDAIFSCQSLQCQPSQSYCYFFTLLLKLLKLLPSLFKTSQLLPSMLKSLLLLLSCFTTFLVKVVAAVDAVHAKIVNIVLSCRSHWC